MTRRKALTPGSAAFRRTGGGAFSTVVSDHLETLMRHPALYLVVSAFSLAVAACQPAEGPAERAGKAIDNAAEKTANQFEKAGDKARDAVNDAKK